MSLQPSQLIAQANKQPKSRPFAASVTSMKKALVAFVLGHVGACQAPLRDTGPYVVGVSHRLIRHPTLPDLPSEIWYPAAMGARERRLVYGEAFLGQAARDAALNTSRRLGVVVLLHGLKGTRFDLSWLAEALAQIGYVVIAGDHIGCTADTYDAAIGPKMWRRADEAAWLVDSLLSDPAWAPHLDAQNVAAIGHSAGGSAVMLMAGAKLSPERFLQRYPRSGPVPPSGTAGALSRGTLSRVAALAPGTGQVFADEGIAQAQVPVLIVSGQKDVLTPERDNAGRYARVLPRAQWHSLKEVGHYTFKPLCTLYGKLRARGICVDDATCDRAHVHRQVAAWVREFLAAQAP